jgi:hypothetical protein
MRLRLENHGGEAQQDRMIRDKRRSLDKAVLYSYQGADVRIINTNQSFKALINPNKNKPDYDDKILSIGFESGFIPGTIFEWERTGTKWLIYLQDLTELAYFKGDIRKCSYEIAWEDPDTHQTHITYAAVRGPVETKINFIQKNGISVDTPNHSLNIMLPKTEDTVQYFKRYSKFYLRGILDTDSKICWRVEGFDSISTPGILEITAVEYYANEFEDDIEEGIAGGLITKPVEVESAIKGEGFIAPKIAYTYTYEGSENAGWVYDTSLPITAEVNDKEITITWTKGYSGQFDLSYGNTVRAIVIESLF